MRSNFLSFAKMQVSALSQIVWLQLLCLVLFPLFFNQINTSHDFASTFIYIVGMLMLSYLIIRNFAFNDTKYQTKMLFSILPVTPGTIIAARGAIVYLFCLISTPVLVLFSNIFHMIKPARFASIPIHILPDSLLLLAIFLPIEFLIFYIFETQKADIIAALAPFVYMVIIFFVHKYLMNSPLVIIVLILAVAVNAACYLAAQKLYKTRQV